MSKILIGIYAGTKTGVCVLIGGKFFLLETMLIHRAMELVLKAKQEYGSLVHVFVEDARLRCGNPSDKKSHMKQQGVGSVKRDASIWEDFLRDHGISFTMVDPKRNRTKTTHDQFCKITGWTGGRTNEHNRDAAMLLWGKQ